MSKFADAYAAVYCSVIASGVLLSMPARWSSRWPGIQEDPVCPWELFPLALKDMISALRFIVKTSEAAVRETARELPRHPTHLPLCLARWRRYTYHELAFDLAKAIVVEVAAAHKETGLKGRALAAEIRRRLDDLRAGVAASFELPVLLEGANNEFLGASTAVDNASLLAAQQAAIVSLTQGARKAATSLDEESSDLANDEPLKVRPGFLVYKGNATELVGKPWAVLDFLLRQVNYTATQKQLFDEIWADEPVGPEVVRQAVSTARKALVFAVKEAGESIGDPIPVVDRGPRAAWRLALPLP